MNVIQKLENECQTDLESVRLRFQCRKCKRFGAVNMKYYQALYQPSKGWFVCMLCEARGEKEHEHERRGK